MNTRIKNGGKAFSKKALGFEQLFREPKVKYHIDTTTTTKPLIPSTWGEQHDQKKNHTG